MLRSRAMTGPANDPPRASTARSRRRPRRSASSASATWACRWSSSSTGPGFPVLGFDIDAKKVDALRRRELLHRAHRRRAHPGGGGGRPAPGDRGLRPSGRGRRRPHLRAHSAHAAERARPLLHRERRPTPSPATLRPGQLVVLESTTYPGTTEEVVQPRLEAQRPARGARDFFLALQPRARGPGQRRALDAEHPQGGRRRRPPVGTAGGGAVRRRARPGDPRVLRARGGGGEDPGEHLSGGQHRPRERAEGHLRGHGHRRLGGHRGGPTKPFGFARVLPGPGLGRPLHPHRPVLPDVEGARVRLSTRFIELAGEINTSMPQHVVRRLAAALNEDGQALARRPRAGPGRGLQEEHRRRAREPGPRDHRDAPAGGAPRSTTTIPTSPRCPGCGATRSASAR